MSGKGSLKGKFENYGAAPNSNAWEGISAGIPAKQKKKTVIWWLFASSGVAASLLISFFIINSRQIEQAKVVDASEIEKSLQNTDNQDNFETLEFENSDNESSLNIASSEIEESSVNEKLVPKNQAVNSSSKSSKSSNFAKSNKKNDQRKPELATNTEKLLKPKSTTEDKLAKPLNQSSDQKDEFNDELAQELIDVKLEKSESKTDIEKVLLAEDLKRIDLIGPQEGHFINTTKSELLLSKIEVKSNEISRWQWGGKLGSDIATRRQSFGGSVTNFSESDLFVSQTDTTVTDLWNVATANNEWNPLYSKINRPISASFLVRFSPITRLFIEVDPTVTFLRAKILPNSLTLADGSQISGSPSPKSKSTFVSISSGISIGYKFLNKKRWALDAVGGMNYEKLANGWLPLNEKPIHLLGSQIQVGVNYHLSENTSLRLAPEFSWIYGNSDRLLLRQLQNTRSIGVEFSLLRDF